MTNPFEDFGASLARIERAAIEHKTSCTSTPCERCNRFLCRGCGAPQAFHGTCDSCRAKAEQARWTQHVLATIPRAFTAATLDAAWLVGLVGSKTIGEAREALAETRVVAVGPPGAGKTSLVAAMLAATAPQAGKFSTLWISSHDLAKARAQHPLGEGEAPLIARALSATMLVLDELGGEDQRYASAVAEVLYERHAQDLATWATTGVGPREISARYGGGIARRVFEDATVFRLVGGQR